MRAFDRGPNLGSHLGSKEPSHIRRWVEGQLAGRQHSPRCGAHTRTGAACRMPALTGEYRCTFHLGGTARARYDTARYGELCHIAATKGGVTGARAARRLTSIERRRLIARWRVDLSWPGSTVPPLEPCDEAAVADWLASCGLDLTKPLPQTGQLPTPRCIDRIMWTAIHALTGRLEKSAEKRMRNAIAADARFFAKLAGPTVWLDPERPPL